jgi:hypothetical protein
MVAGSGKHNGGGEKDCCECFHDEDIVLLFVLFKAGFTKTYVASGGLGFGR